MITKPCRPARFFAPAMLVVAILQAGVVSAEMYSWTDADGNRVYSDKRQSDNASATQPSQRGNYYTPSSRREQTADPQNTEEAGTELPVLEALAADTEEGEHAADDGLSEAECQRQYQRSCDAVNNWREHALEQCGDDPRCKDEDYLDRKYRPRSQEEILKVARRAGVRKNNFENDVEQYLKKRYTTYCKDQAEFQCAYRADKQRLGKRLDRGDCEAQFIAHCRDNRNLQQFFSQYNSLSVAEKKAIIAQAEAVAKANGQSDVDIQKLVTSLIDILISRAVMGL